MQLSEHEHRWLAEIENRLIEEEPRLHRALATLRSRPLLGARLIRAGRAAVQNRRARLVMSAVALAAGVAVLVAGVAEGGLAIALAGIVTAQFGPWLLVHRRHHRMSVRPQPPGRPAGALRP